MSIGLYSFIYAPTRMLEWDRYSCWMDSGLQVLAQMPEIIQKLSEKEGRGELNELSVDDDLTKASKKFQKELLKILRRLKKVDKNHKPILAGKKGPAFELNRGLSRLLQMMIDYPILQSGKIPEHSPGAFDEFIHSVFKSTFGEGNKVVDMGQSIGLLTSGESEKKYAKLDASEDSQDIDNVYCFAYLSFDENNEDFKKKSYVPLMLTFPSTSILGERQYELFAMECEGKLTDLDAGHGTVMVKQEDGSWWYFNDLEAKREKIDLKADLDMHQKDDVGFIKIFCDKFTHMCNNSVYGIFYGDILIYRKINPMQGALNRLKENLMILKNKLLSLRTQLENLRTKIGK